MSTVYSLEPSTGVRSVGFTLGLLAVACIFCLAPASLLAEDGSAGSKAELSDEQLTEKRQQARSDLLELRRRRHQARLSVQANNEKARAIEQEMNELRRKLREKNAELEAVMNEDERFEEWAETEQELIKTLQDFKEKRRQRLQ